MIHDGLPDSIAFYKDERKLGGLYFFKNPPEVRVLDPSFETLAEKLREAYRSP